MKAKAGKVYTLTVSVLVLHFAIHLCSLHTGRRVYVIYCTNQSSAADPDIFCGSRSHASVGNGSGSMSTSLSYKLTGLVLPDLYVTSVGRDVQGCGEPAISLHSYTVPLVQWSTRLLPVMRDPGSIPKGVLMWNRDSPVSVVWLKVTISALISWASLCAGCFKSPFPLETSTWQIRIWVHFPEECCGSGSGKIFLILADPHTSPPALFLSTRLFLLPHPPILIFSH
jgi:hypothetical protein